MIKPREIRENPDVQQIENARVGYQVAISLWTLWGQALWHQFHALMTVNSIVLAAAILAISRPEYIPVVSIGMPVIGLLLCALWLPLLARGFGNAHYWALSARELEKRFLNNAVSNVWRGRDFTRGEEVKFVFDEKGEKQKSLQMSWLGRIMRTEWFVYISVLVFFGMHLAILIWIIWGQK